MANLQVLSEHLKLASCHLPRRLQQASMDGSNLVFLEKNGKTYRWPFGGARRKRVSTPSSSEVTRSSRRAAQKRATTWSFGRSAWWSGKIQWKRAATPSSGKTTRKRALVSLSGKATQSSNRAGWKRAPASSSAEAAWPFDRARRKRAPALSSGRARRKRATTQLFNLAQFRGMARAQPNGRGRSHNDLEEWQEGRRAPARASLKPWGENFHGKNEV
ncbi:unnamed protein product [Sphagnum jensenii]|uniref:Uncharacterized protein n=1 Tax=Sphagnum jensenii TaxID=128206 RepID=A0ABP1BAP6_9BRYO